MAQTEFFDLPLISPNDKCDPASDINKLADRVDRALAEVEQLGKDAGYKLPAATKDTLGGIICGDSLSIDGEGTLSAKYVGYTLPPATRNTLGGVIVGAGLTIETDGELHIDDESVSLPDGSVTAEKIADNAVNTSKLADGSVTLDKFEATLKSNVEQAISLGTGQANDVPITYSLDTAHSGNLKCYQWGPVVSIVATDMPLVADGSTTSYAICSIPSLASAYGDYLGQVSAPLVVPVTVYKDGSAVSGASFGNSSQRGPFSEGFRLTTSSALATGSYTVSFAATFITLKGIAV